MSQPVSISDSISISIALELDICHIYEHFHLFFFALRGDGVVSTVTSKQEGCKSESPGRTRRTGDSKLTLEVTFGCLYMLVLTRGSWRERTALQPPPTPIRENGWMNGVFIRSTLEQYLFERFISGF